MSVIIVTHIYIKFSVCDFRSIRWELHAINTRTKHGGDCMQTFERDEDQWKAGIEIECGELISSTDERVRVGVKRWEDMSIYTECWYHELVNRTYVVDDRTHGSASQDVPLQEEN